jgi:5-methylcytosine-specific restriction protein A
VRERAGGRCEVVEDGARCARAGGECDHIVAGDDHSLANLQWICVPHHRVKSSREGAAATPRLLRPPERHPAL